jgi:5-methylcytosine-specific restriction protein A
MKSPEQRIRNREHDARRKANNPWRTLYDSAQWKALRRNQLMREPLCKRCKDRGTLTPATVVHHKVAHKGNVALFFDANNLASSCKNCHDVDEQRIERGGKARQAVDADGWPIEGEGGTKIATAFRLSSGGALQT